jgi:hypothetical protein
MCGKVIPWSLLGYSALQAGANIAGFVKVAEAMLSQGCV